jgi:hypothetical protein
MFWQYRGAVGEGRPDPATWLTGCVPELVTVPVKTRPIEDATPETDEPKSAHIVKVEPGESAAAKVVEARIYGTPIEALCGFVWVPSRDPKTLPVCQECKSIYDMYKIFNDGLRDAPDD